MSAVLGRSVVAFLCLQFCGVAFAATTINLESRHTGEKVLSQYSNYGGGVIVNTNNFTAGHPDVAIAFDSSTPSAVDPDLCSPWDGGNIAPTTIMGKILVIAENDIDNNHDGYVDVPDDEGGIPAGEIKFSFTELQTSFGLDVIDVEPGTEKAGSFLSFRNSSGVELRKVMFSDFTTAGTTFYDPTIVWGDNFANHIRPLTAAQLGIANFSQVVIRFGWCFGVDNIVFSNTIPEPASLALLGLPALALVRRQRR